MTDTTESAPEATVPAEEENTTTSSATEPDDQDLEPGNANSEAARYRRRLRDTEAERDTLKTRLEALQRGEVERLIADRFADPADIWRDGATLDTLLDKDGHVDSKAVDNLAATLLEAHQHWAVPKKSPSGFQSGASAAPQPRQNAFAQAFKPHKR